METFKNHYVYALLNKFKPCNIITEDFSLDYEPYYIGVGKGYRITEHFKEKYMNKDVNIPKTKFTKSLLNKFSEKELCVKLYEGLSQDEAFNLEIKLIKNFGKIKDGGILTNIADGGVHTNANIVGGDNIHSKKVYEYDLQGNFLRVHDSLRNINSSVNYNTIGDSCRENCNTEYYSRASSSMWFYDFKGDIIEPYVRPKDRLIPNAIYIYDANKLELIKKFKSTKEVMIYFGCDKQLVSTKSRLLEIYKRKYILSKNELSKEDLLKIWEKYIRYVYKGLIFKTVEDLSIYMNFPLNSLKYHIHYKINIEGLKIYRKNEQQV